jgi:uncharacterized protein
LTAVVVMAKAPLAGRVKTRLVPPCTPGEAAALAEAALADTLSAAAASAARRRVVALEGAPGDWVPDGFDVIPQSGGGLAARLAAAFEAVGGPAIAVGMDTPQLRPDLLDDAMRMLLRDGTDAVLGEAEDGGYWAIGLRETRPEAFRGVPMSRPWTGRAQRARLVALGLECASLPILRDVDTIADARAVAASHPELRFARELASLENGDARWSMAVG